MEQKKETHVVVIEQGNFETKEPNFYCGSFNVKIGGTK